MTQTWQLAVNDKRLDNLYRFVDLDFVCRIFTRKFARLISATAMPKFGK